MECVPPQQDQQAGAIGRSRLLGAGCLVRRTLSTLLWLSVAVAAGLTPQPATAQVTQSCHGRIAQLQQLVIECRPGYATDTDRVTIYTPYELDPSRKWSEQLDYSSSAWIFDVAADGIANLIITFGQEEEEVVAKLYDDSSGDGSVSYALEGIHVRVDEGPPTVTVRAKHSWWLPDGSINFNVDMALDGPVVAMIDADIYLHQLATDGIIDTTVHVRDLDADGRPDYEWRQALPPLPEDSGYYRSSLMVNNADDEPPIHKSLWWPWLGSVAPNFIKEDYASVSSPPINIDWSRSKIDYLVEAVASRNRPHNFFVYSVRRIEEGTINNVNFESPFAFYQFSPYQSNFPDVALRVAYWPRGDVSKKFAVQQVDFSWRQSEENIGSLPNWDYRLGLLGHNAYHKLIVLPEFSLRMTPYAELPAWVATSSWDYASFVAREEGEYLSSEGIYEWASLEGVIVDVRNQPAYEDILLESRLAQEGYASGAVEEVPAKYYSRIREGLRGEFRASAGPPQLYLSTLDRKLHLLGANHGLWQVSPRAALRYANLNGDAYIDQWLYTETPADPTAQPIRRELNVAADYVLYSDTDRLVIRNDRVEPSLFATRPPTSREEWQALGAQIAGAGPAPTPADLEALLAPFAGPETRLTGVQLQEYRPIGRAGFRFKLTLRPGFQVLGDDLLAIAGRAPGSYVVTYDGAFRVEPLTPPLFVLDVGGATLTALETGRVPIEVQNTGLQDVPEAVLELWAATPTMEPALVMTQTVALRSGEVVRPALIWTPPAPGAWTLTARLSTSDGRLLLAAPRQVTVLPRQDVTVAALLPRSTAPRLIPVALLALLALATLAAWCFKIGAWSDGKPNP